MRLVRIYGSLSAAHLCGGEYLVYDLVDEADEIIYVGSSRRNAFDRRIRYHLERWGYAIGDVLSSHFPDAVTMLDAERRRIRDLKPPLNVSGI